MPMATVQQTSFNGGEISEAMYGRTDLAKYDTSVRTMRNFIPTLQGNAVNRPGTQFVCEVIDSTKTSRLIPFQFSVTQAYVLEFGDGIMRVIADGGLVVYPAGHASEGDPVEVITPYADEDVNRIQYAQSADVLFLVHPLYPPQKISRFSNTEWTCETIAFGSSVAIPASLASAAVGTAQYYKVTAIIGGEESLASAEAGSSSATSTLSWTAVFGAEYYNVYKLKNGVYGWIGEAGSASFTDATISPDLDKRPPESNNPFSSDPVVDTIGPNILLPNPMTSTGNTSVSGAGDWSTITTTDWYGSGSYTLYQAFEGPETSGTGYLTTTTATPSTVITFNHTSSVAIGAYSFRTDSNRSGPRSWTLEGYDGADWITLDTRSGEVNWAAYEKRIFTFINEVAYEKYRVSITQNGESNYSTFRKIEFYEVTYSAAANYPGSVTLHQQRLIFARTDANPQTLFGSQTGNFYNFNTSRPLQDDDAYEFTIFSNQVNEVQWLAAIRSLLAGSSGAEWEITAGSNGGAITPTSVNITAQGNRGSEPIIPVIIGSSLLFVARGGRSIRDYGYNFDIDGYTGDDLTVLASHFFDESSVKDWAFQKNPYSVLWVVEEDGSLYGLTYDKNQQVVGWHQHDTGCSGLFESVAVIPGD